MDSKKVNKLLQEIPDSEIPILSKDEWFPVNDMPTYEEQKKLGIAHPNNLNHRYSSIGAVIRQPEEFRPPKKGEYYLSGSQPAAYRAHNDLNYKYMICDLVRTEKVVLYKVMARLGKDA